MDDNIYSDNYFFTPYTFSLLIDLDEISLIWEINLKYYFPEKDIIMDF